MLEVGIARLGEHSVSFVLVVEKHDRVGDGTEDPRVRRVWTDDEHLATRPGHPPELAQRRDGIGPVLYRPRRPHHVECIVVEGKPLGVAAVEGDTILTGELGGGLLELVLALVEAVNDVDVFEQALGREARSTADVEHVGVGFELEHVDGLVAHGLGPNEGVDPVVDLREIFVEKARARLVLEDAHRGPIRPVVLTCLDWGRGNPGMRNRSPTNAVRSTGLVPPDFATTK